MTIFRDLAVVAGFLAGGVVFGFLVEKIVLAQFKKLALRTPWEADNILFESLQNIPLLSFVLAGCYGAVAYSAIDFSTAKLLEKVLLILFILCLTTFVARLTSGLVELYSRKPGTASPVASILKNVTRVMVYLLGCLSIFHALGINITPALTALGVGGIAVALALKDTLSNLFSGLQIIASKQISQGDFIALESGQEGYVADITWRTTTILTLPGNLVVVPNSVLASTIFTNYHQPNTEIGTSCRLAVSYDSDLERVEQITLEVAREVMKEVAGGIPEFEPQVRYLNFGEYSVEFSVNLRAMEFRDQITLKHEFIKRVLERYRREKIQIPFPVRVIQMGSNQKTALRTDEA